MKTEIRRSNIALAVLAFLQEAPMHPYRMQQLIKERGKDEVINVQQRASLYQTIKYLLRAELIQVRETEREPNRPERTIYALTDAGRQTLHQWLRAMLATPAGEFPEFPAALAYLILLTPADAVQQLQRRSTALRAEVTRLEGQLQQAGQNVPRLFLIELEYLHAALTTELTWVESLVDDIQTGRLTWNDTWKAEMMAQFSSHE